MSGMVGTSASQGRSDIANVGNPEISIQPTYRRFPSMRLPNPSTWHFDIDESLNRIVPAPPWRYLPYPVAHFLGYRKGKLPEIGNIVMIFWAAIGIFCSIILIELASRRIPAMEQNNTLIVASFVSSSGTNRPQMINRRIHKRSFPLSRPMCVRLSFTYHFPPRRALLPFSSSMPSNPRLPSPGT